MKKTVIKRRKRVPAVGPPASQPRPAAAAQNDAAAAANLDKDKNAATRASSPSVVIADVSDSQGGSKPGKAGTARSRKTASTPAAAAATEHERLGHDLAAGLQHDYPRRAMEDDHKADLATAASRGGYGMSIAEVELNRFHEKEREAVRASQIELDRERSRIYAREREMALQHERERGRERERERERERDRDRERERLRQKEREGVSGCQVLVDLPSTRTK
jgi:hypothetical protein